MSATCPRMLAWAWRIARAVPAKARIGAARRTITRAADRLMAAAGLSGIEDGGYPFLCEDPISFLPPRRLDDEADRVLAEHHARRLYRRRLDMLTPDQRRRVAELVRIPLAAHGASAPSTPV